jgi:hypothetical protein
MLLSTNIDTICNFLKIILNILKKTLAFSFGLWYKQLKETKVSCRGVVQSTNHRRQARRA